MKFFVDHDWELVSPSWASNETYECNRCGASVYYYEHNVPCMTVTRTSYWDSVGKACDVEPTCAERG